VRPSPLRTANDLDVAGKRVLVRSDLNVPLADGPGDSKTITDDGRIRASVPLLRSLMERGAKVVVAAHLGRPKGEHDPAYSLAPVGERLQELLGAPVRIAQDVVGESAQEAVRATEADRVVLLENVRFEAAETSKDDAERGAFADRLAALADLYVDDAFGAVHRKHASVYDVAQRLPHAAGPLIEAEVAVLRRLTQDPARPYVVVLGGSKVSDKLKVLSALLPVVDKLLVGGGMCFTFLAAQGHDVGSSLLEADQLEVCRGFLETGKIVLPVDVVAADRFAADAQHDVVPADAIPADRMGLDIGPQSVERFAGALAGARTVFWNGPMGVFELAPYAAGTRGVAEAVAALSSAGSDALTVVGGGDSAAAVRALGIDEARFTHISTGGGASLEYLEGKALPGLVVLETRDT
jgi:phosphoglycerate kinase